MQTQVLTSVMTQKHTHNLSSCCKDLQIHTYTIVCLDIHWGEPEQAPHKWYIACNLLQSDGTAYIGTYVCNSNSKRYGKQLYTLACC